MNIVVIQGGFGNQMFQYAFCKKLELMGREVRADISCYERPNANRSFSLKDAFPDIELNTEGAKEEHQRVYEAFCNRPFLLKVYQYVFRSSRPFVYDDFGRIYNLTYLQRKDHVYEGFWQSEKYWVDKKEEIRSCFRFREIQNERFQQIKEICTSGNTVSLHVRRSDYLNPAFNGRYSDICTEEYYNQAASYMIDHVPDARFVIFSDDVQWVKENWARENWVFAADYLDADIPDWAEMELMSLCRHNIIANSTFSWWGAYLNHNPV